LGIRVRRVADWIGTQWGISYGRMGSEQEVHDTLTSLGVTHLLLNRAGAKGYASIASDLMFHSYYEHYAQNPKSFGGLELSEVNNNAPEVTRTATDVAVFSCGVQSTAHGYLPGVYRLLDVNRSPLERDSAFPAPKQALPGNPNEYQPASEIRFLVTYQNCSQPKWLTRYGFRQLVKRPSETLWARSP
jgi:hypothetical protein